MNNYEQVTQEVRDAFDALCKGRVEAAVKAEREACAKVCDEQYYQHLGPEYGEVRYGIAACAAAIRARSNNDH